MRTEQIRSAFSHHWPAIERLLNAAQLPLAGARDHLRGFVVAERDGAVAACAALEHYGRTALLRSVAVDAAHRGTGLGARLVRQLIANARNEAIDSLFLLTTTAADWFVRFGFVRILRESVPEALHQSAELQGACPSTAIVMTLRLRP